uniref:PGC-1 and ERR-induced regulator in muscle protein 1 n=1 Tax=Scatophagus argus TaxID=75038 RepID=UPI001ED7D6E8|nr:PGC-1 and ERR-induced regulator in muscle protein 1 [Scatophagus argus]
MEEFEYSVEISDRDWECFFVECEECNLLPPSLAGVDDSGMSDIDETGSIFAKRVQKVSLTAGFSEIDRPIDGPPDCEGSPAEHYLSKHGVGGMESVLSGSEEDIHLQSINIFFERLKNATEAERISKPSQVRAGKNREAMQCDWQQASSNTLPKNIPKLMPARGETAVGKRTSESVDTISSITTKDEPGFSSSPEPAASNSVLQTNQSAHSETKLLITEEACTKTRVSEPPQWSQTHDSSGGVATTPHTGKVMKVVMCTPLDDVKQEDLFTDHVTLKKKCSTDSWSDLEMVTNVKWKEDPNVLQSDTTSPKKRMSQESSPSASVRRKRRRKRRLSTEPAESVHGCERQVLVKPSDSEEEQCAWRGGADLCIFEDINSFYLNEPQKNVTSLLNTYSANSSVPGKISVKEIKVSGLSHFSPPCESIVRLGRCEATGSAENNATNKRSITPPSQTDDNVMCASNNSNNSPNLQPCSKLQEEKSAGLPVSVSDSVTDISDLTTETANCGREAAHIGCFWQSDQMNNSVVCCENEQLCTAEVKSLTDSISLSAESNDPTVEVGQNDKHSYAKPDLAEGAVDSDRDNHTLCQREAEPQQQLEIDCRYTDQYSSMLEKTHYPLSADGMSSSDALNAKPKPFNTGICPFLDNMSTRVDCAKPSLDTSNSLSDKCCPSESFSRLDINIPVQETDKSTTAEKAKFPATQITACHSGNIFLSGELNLRGKSQRETNSPMSEDLLTSPSDITPVSSFCSVDTESVMSLSSKDMTDMSGSSCISVSQNDSRGQGENTSLTLTKHQKGDFTSGSKSPSVSNDAADSKYDLVLEEVDAIAASKAECGPGMLPDSKQSVFAMSSFWSEMEKLTINDILGLRMISKAAPAGSLAPLQESEETDVFALTDSGFFTQLDESKPEQINEDMSSGPNSVESSSAPVSSTGVMWDSKPVPVNLGPDIYTGNMMLTSDISQAVLPENTQTCIRKICKNVSVHNLHALESFSYTWKGQTLQNLDKGELEKVEYFTDGHMLKQDKDVDCSASSATDSYGFSLTDIFQYLFGGKQSNPSHSATDNITTCYTDGNSVPETYDHFFSEFDTESFFYPLITAEDQTKDELVPVFSCSRSANRNLQFPESYEYFFASSSSDESSVESDEEDYCGPVRVVNKFSRTSSSSKICTDIYENFFTDRDLRQDFFWKNTLSLRNITFTGSSVHKQSLSNSLVPVRSSGSTLGSRFHSVNALGNQDVVFSDSLLYHLEDRISRQLVQQPFKYEELQTTVSNPRLDASLLPLKQSDMCLVCIAFASWVLKTANPQVGDAWKAVLLANVSALSAIRYLRKYVKMEEASNERKLQLTAPSES